MAVQDIECQIAKGQIERYLSGAPFSSEALQQLEEHIAECNGCKQLLNQRKTVLMSMLGYANAVVQDTEAIERPKTVAAALRWTKRPKAQQAPAPAGTLKPNHLFKPLMYALVLAGVLIGMSYYSRTLTKPFGNHVIETETTAAPIEQTEPASEPKATIIPVYTDRKPAPVLTQPAPPLTAPNQTKPTATPANAKAASPVGTSSAMSSGRTSKQTAATEKAKAAASPAGTRSLPVAKPKVTAGPNKKTVTRTIKRIRKPNHATNGVRVYDPQGNLLPAR